MSYVAWVRERVGHRKVFLVYTSVVLRDDRGRVLLQRRTDFDVWGLPGGVLERDETLEDCARRELREETGLTAGDLSLVGLYSSPAYDVSYPNGDEAQQFTVCFSGERTGGEMAPDGDESSEQHFFDPAGLPLDRVPAWYAAMIRDALRGGPPAFDPVERVEVGGATADGLPPDGGLWIWPAVAAVIVDDAGRVLVRSAGEAVGLPSALVRLGESAAEAVVRVCREQAGLTARPERLLGVLAGQAPPRAGGVAQYAVALFAARAGDPLLASGTGGRWLESGEIDAAGLGLEPDAWLLVARYLQPSRVRPQA